MSFSIQRSKVICDMAEQAALFYFVASALLLLPSQIHSIHSGDYRVLISNSGLTKLGETTAFDAEVVLNSRPKTPTRHASNENITYEFYWNVTSGPWIKHNKTTHRWDSFRWRWSRGGQKTVFVYVQILIWSYPNSTGERRYHNGYSSYYAMNRTDVTVTGSNDAIIASLDAHQDSLGNNNGSNTEFETFIAGMVLLEVIIQKPQDLDLDEITFDWNFGDGSQLHNSQLQNVTHNFTTVQYCTIKVNIHGWSLGRYYSGTTSKTLKFTANVQAYLEIKSSSGSKLPSGHPIAIAKNSPVTFEVEFKDPFEVITGVSIDWKFGDGASVIDRKNTTIIHMYDKERNYTLWVTIRVYTKYFGKRPFVLTVIETLCVKDVIIASLHAHQDSLGNKNGSNTDLETFVAGMLLLEVIIQTPQDLDGITFDWDFGDGSQLNNSQLQNVTHNFTTIQYCTIKVNIQGWSLGRNYSGTARKTLKFTANVQAYLEMKTSAGPKLPPGHPNAVAKNSPVTFKVKFKDPFEVITGVSIDWKFGDRTSVTGRNNTTIVHTYSKEECSTCTLWVTIRVYTKYFGKNPFPLTVTKTLHVKERVFLAVQHKHLPEHKRVIFNISCNGSLPVSFHWCVSRRCNLPPGDICSPTVEHKNSCSLIVNHLFHDSGKYCVNVGVMNDVSGTNTSLMVQIPGDSEPKHSTGKISAGTLVSLFVAILLIISVTVIVVRKWIYTRREKTEKADFDFRDEDTPSLSSLDLYGKHSCFPRCKLWGSCTRQEYVPLRIQAGDYRLYTQ